MSNSLEKLKADIQEVSAWELCVVQLLKDFSRGGVTLSINENDSFDKVVHELIKVLYKLHINDLARLERLFYLIDIPQEIYLQIVSSDRDIIAERLAQVVLLRTFKKIQSRAHNNS